MDRKTLRQAALLGGLAIVLGVLVVTRVVPALRGPAAAPGQSRADPGARGAAPLGFATELDLSRLDGAAVEAPAVARNPFRFDARETAPAGSTLPVPVPSPGSPEFGSPAASAASDAVSPIPLKFIGILTVHERDERIAVLTDGRDVYHGHAGEVIDGRFRIVQIGEESIQVEHADGRGRQTIRLTGS